MTDARDELVDVIAEAMTDSALTHSGRDLGTLLAARYRRTRNAIRGNPQRTGLGRRLPADRWGSPSRTGNSWAYSTARGAELKEAGK